MPSIVQALENFGEQGSHPGDTNSLNRRGPAPRYVHQSTNLLASQGGREGGARVGPGPPNISGPSPERNYRPRRSADMKTS